MEALCDLSKDVDTEGFDLEGGKTWIYPTNKPVRDYQMSIVKEALFKNTMVCLPTGLGKTFIAAVVMYNYFRWYPTGKIIFMAPTRPLVKQQVDACYEIVGIPQEATVELTGTTAKTSRDKIWDEKRVFFVTPQVVQNDVERITQLGGRIKCIVFDEAHRARGNHAYCEVIRSLSSIQTNFRVLALSATPGSSIVDVIKVCAGLLISHLEIRTEDSKDVVPYVFKRTVETVVVPFGEKITQIQKDYIMILDKYVRTLVKHGIVQGNCSTLTKGRLFYIKKEFEEKSRSNRPVAYNEIMKTLTICGILYHAFEVLQRHGLRGFLNFFLENHEKPLLKNNFELHAIMDDVSGYLGPAPDVEMRPDGTIPEIPAGTVFGHPKYYKLAEILEAHFASLGTETKAIVFCEYQESVREAFAMLLLHRPVIKARIFAGQGAISQKQQINVISSFRSGESNVLISTCVGEEGLDVGDVDLVICFDITSKSNVRMVQRMGRTGRKREGRVVMLVTAGREQQTLQECLQEKTVVMNAIVKSNELRKELYKNCPRMVPVGITPVCQMMRITVPETPVVTKRRNNDLKNMFLNMKQPISELVFIDRIKPTRSALTGDLSEVKFCKSLEKQRKLQADYGEIKSSKCTEMFVSLLQFADSKRFNLPILQSSLRPNNYKQSDIRHMFQSKTETDKPRNDDKEKYLHLHAALDQFILIKAINSCQFCDRFTPCDLLNGKDDDFNFNDWIIPEISILDELKEDTWMKEHTKMSFPEDEFDDVLANFDEASIERPTQKGYTQLENELCDASVDIEKKSVLFVPPESAKKILKNHAVEDRTKHADTLSYFKANSLDLFGEINAEEKKSIDLEVNSKISMRKFPNSQDLFDETPKKSRKQDRNDSFDSDATITYSPNYEMIDLLSAEPSPKLVSNELKSSQNLSRAGSSVESETKKKFQSAKTNSVFDVTNKSHIAELGDIIDLDDFFESDDEFAEILKDMKTNSSRRIRKRNLDTSKKSGCENVATRTKKNKEMHTFDSNPNIGKQNRELSSEWCVGNVRNSNEDKFVLDSDLNSDSNSRSNVHSPDIYLEDELNSGLRSSETTAKRRVLPFTQGDSTRVARLKDKKSVSQPTRSPMSKPNLSTLKQTKVKQARLEARLSVDQKNVERLNDTERNVSDSRTASTSTTSTSTTSTSTSSTSTTSTSTASTSTASTSTALTSITAVSKIKSSSTNAKSKFTDDDIFDASFMDFSPRNTSITTSTQMVETVKPDVSVESDKREKKKFVMSPDIFDSKSSGSEGSTSRSRIKDSSGTIGTSRKENNSKNVKRKLNLNDICDSSILDFLDDDFKVEESKNVSLSKAKRAVNKSKLSISDICDLSMFDILTGVEDKVSKHSLNISKPKMNGSPRDKESSSSPIKPSKKFKSHSGNLGLEDDDMFVKPLCDLSKTSLQLSPTLNRFKYTPKRSFLERTRNDIESNDDFVRTPPPKRSFLERTRNDIESDDDFVGTPPPKRVRRKKTKLKRERSKRENCDFIDDHADVSSDAPASSDETDSPDKYCQDDSFVDDEDDITNELDATSMHAIYLKSVKSPVLGRGAFKIPKLPSKVNQDIYSQRVDLNETNEYVYDSFCVNSELICDASSSQSLLELGELEIAENNLKKKRTEKKKTKRRRILVVSDDSE